MSTVLDKEKTLETHKKKVLEPPLMYKVVLHNDDYTPMDFVVELLMRFFNKNVDDAIHITHQIHTHGKGICGLYSKDIAYTKCHNVNNYARQNEHPLLCSVEKA